MSVMPASPTPSSSHDKKTPLLLLPDRSGGGGASSHNSKADWDRHRDTIIRLYWQRNLPLREVQDIMEREHGFYAS